MLVAALGANFFVFVLFCFCYGKNCIKKSRNLSLADRSQSLTELPECARYRQFVRNLNPCARDLKIAVCSDVRDLDNFAIK